MKEWLREREKYRREEGLSVNDSLNAAFGDPLDQGTRDFAAACLIVTPVGILLIRDVAEEWRNSWRHWWKLPGGRKELGESPVQTVIRETRGKTGGFEIDPHGLRLIETIDKGDHDMYFFRIDAAARRFNTTGSEGEKVGIFSPERILAMKDFFPPHHNAVCNELWMLYRRVLRRDVPVAER